MKYLLLSITILILLGNTTALVAQDSEKKEKQRKFLFFNLPPKKSAKPNAVIKDSTLQNVPVLSNHFVLQSGEPVCGEELLIEDMERLIAENADKNEPPYCPEEPIEIGSYFLPNNYFSQYDYFNIWDSKNVDPYEINILEFNDTVALQLHDTEHSYAYPIDASRITSAYGPRRYRFHHGIDLKLEKGDPVRAAFGGVVRIAKYNRGGYGHYVMLRHPNGLETLYGHLTKYYVEVGQEVAAGEIIGLGGNTGRSTGSHLHFETRYYGQAFDPTLIFNFDDWQDMPGTFVLSRDSYDKLIDEKKAQYYYVRNGDSLWVISRRYRTSINRICQLNSISRKKILRPGMRLRVR